MASKKETINVSIFSQEGEIYKGEARALFIPYKNEEIAILPEHTPIIALIDSGDIKVVDEQGKRTITTTKSGILHVGEEEVSVLVNA